MPAVPLLPIRRQAEWSFVRFLRGVYSGENPESWLPLEALALEKKGLTGKGRHRAVFEQAGPLISKGTWRFMVRQGGYRRREVVVKGKARTGRLWDEPVWGNDPLTIGGATLAWLAALHDCLVNLATSGAEEEAGQSFKLPPQGDPATFSAGDRLALSAALASLLKTPALAPTLAVAAATLAARAPGFALAHPRFLPETLAWKFSDDAESMALQYFDDWIALSWVNEMNRVRRMAALEQTAAHVRLTRLMSALLDAGKGPETAHLLVPLARFFPLLWRDMGGAAGIAASIRGSSDALATTSDREKFEARAGDVLNCGVRLDDRVNSILQTPWPDRTESHKRLVTEHETRYRPIRDEVRLLARRLRRELG